MDMTKYKLTKEDSTRIDLTSYPDIRKELIALRSANVPDSAFTRKKVNDCTDDMVAVGPAGERSIGNEQWKKGFEKNAVSFKKVALIPNSGQGTMPADWGDEFLTWVLRIVAAFFWG